jgi:hypothetical protein
VAWVALNLGEDPLGRVVGMTLRRPLAQLNVILPGKLGRGAPLPEKSGVLV